QDGLKEADKIARLPGQPNGVDFEQYAGYVIVDPQAGRALFYYFAEAPKKSSGDNNKPLVLWLNGGPGCSSIGSGAMSELGPFYVKSDGKTLYRNAHAWNNFANILFLESPAGVGFSYSNTTADYSNTGDKRTARDSYTFLINWLERFPQYKTSDFFIAGESYAGHYIPQLANLILKNNNKYKDHTTINLKGILIGNAFIDRAHNEEGMFDYVYRRYIITKESYDRIKSTCKFAEKEYSAECREALSVAGEEKGRLNMYNIYGPTCNIKSKDSLQSSMNKGADPCSGYYVESYMNLPEVQTALHANITKLSHQWTECSELVGAMNWKDAPDSVLPEIKQVIDSNIRVWLLSGDFDAVVPLTSTQLSLKTLGLPLETKWSPWHLNKQLGGYFMVYKGLTFATVRGAGHMIPADQSERALKLFRVFLEGTQPPDSVPPPI
ncbi:Peptidase S10 serine carboxypeptidase protein, partial [Dioscorea alata]